MSESKNDLLDLYPVYDERLENLQSKLAYGVYKGADSLVYRQYPSSNISNSQVSWNIKAPSLQSVVDSCFLVETQFSFVVTATSTNDLTLSIGKNMETGTGITDYLTMNALPFNQLIQTCNVSINNAPLSYDSNKLSDLLIRCVPQEVLNKYSDFAPCMKPHLRNYDSITQDCVRSIFNDGSNTTHCVKPNGSFRFDSAIYVAKTSSAPGYLTVTLTTIEPLIHPFLNPEYGTKCFSNVNTIDVNLNLKSTLDQSVMTAALLDFTNPAAPVSKTTVGSVSAPSILSSTLHTIYLKPPTFMPLKTKTLSSYTQPVIVNTREVAAIGAGASVSVSSDTVTFNSIPAAIAIYMRPKLSNSVREVVQNLAFASSAPVSIRFGRSGIMSDTKLVDLAKISERNGMIDQNSENWLGAKSGKQWAVSTAATSLYAGSYYKNIGPVLLLNPVLDFGIPSSLANSVGGSFDFSCDCNFVNTSDATANFEFHVVAFYDGVLVSSLGGSFTFNGMVTQEEALSMDLVPAVPRNEHKLYGSGWLDKLTNFGKKVLNSDVGKALMPVAKDLVKSQICGEGSMYR